MYSKVTDFIEEWKYESESTLKVFDNLTNDSLEFKPNQNVRSPGRLAWHIVTTLGEMVQKEKTAIRFILKISLRTLRESMVFCFTRSSQRVGCEKNAKFGMFYIN